MLAMVNSYFLEVHQIVRRMSKLRIDALPEYASNAAFALYGSLDHEVRTLSEDIFEAVGRTMVSYYSPKWRFMSVFFLQNGLRLQLLSEVLLWTR
jgi:hypothetical protein